MGWDSINHARGTLAEAHSVHKTLLEDEANLTPKTVHAVALEVSEMLIRARDALSSAYDERAELLNEIRKLSAALEKRADITKHLDAYYLSTGNSTPTGEPYCLRCWEVDWCLVHLTRRSNDTNCCPHCDRQYRADMTPFDPDGDRTNE